MFFNLFAIPVLMLHVSASFVSTGMKSPGNAPCPAMSLRRGTNSRSFNNHSNSLKMSFIDKVEQFMIGSIFPENDVKIEEPNKELLCLTDLANGTMDEMTIAHDSLTAFLLEWGKSLEKADGTERLPTPIFCIPYSPTPQLEFQEFFIDVYEKEEYAALIQTSGVKLSFRKTKRYLSKNEQRGLEKGQIPDRKGAKIDSWSPGGILILIQTISCHNPSNESKNGLECNTWNTEHERQRLRLVAIRCDIDGDTVVKVSSERTIIRRLKDAIRVWKKMRSL